MYKQFKRGFKMSELEQDTSQLSVSDSAETKRKNKTLEERIELSKKRTAFLKRKLATRERKERTHRLIEIGAFVESLLKTSSKEETIKTIQLMFKNYCDILKLQEQKMREENEH